MNIIFTDNGFKSNLYDLTEGEDVNEPLRKYQMRLLRQKQGISVTNGINESGDIIFYVNLGALVCCYCYLSKHLYCSFFVNGVIQEWNEFNPWIREVSSIDFTKLHTIFQCVMPFNNWSNEDNFPQIYGCGVMLPCIDSRYFEMLYTTANKLWVGRHRSNNTFEWHNVAGRVMDREFTVNLDSQYGIATVDLRSELQPLEEQIVSITPMYFFDLSQVEYTIALNSDYDFNVICRDRKGKTVTVKVRLFINIL